MAANVETIFYVRKTYTDSLGKEFDELRKKKLADKQVMDYIEILLPMEDNTTPQQRKNISRLREDMGHRYSDALDLKTVGRNAYRFINAVKENVFARTMEGNPLIDKAYQMVKAA